MLKPLNDINLARRPSSAQDNIYELTLADLDAVAGGGTVKQSSGNLSAMCCKGTHIPKVTIEL
ncbi:MAG TPA: hypothetical protein VGD75_16750 [Bradyrhizobium sp.]|jgi:hypothetical protein